MNTLIHIGYHKTGTTFFQDIVFKKHPNVRLIDRSEVQRVFLKVGSFSFNPDAAIRWFSGQKNNVYSEKDWLVISDEELSGNIHTGGNGGYLAKEMAGRLFSVLPDAQISIHIRNQYEMIESVYRQYIKKGGTFNIKKYLFDNDGFNHRFPQFSFEHFEYEKLIKYYISLFGKDNIHIFIYEEMRKNIDTFLEKYYLELQMPVVKDIIQIDKKRVNERLSLVSIFFARFTNRFYGKDPINRRVIFHIPLFNKLCRSVYKGIDRMPLIKHLDRKGSLLNGEIREYIKEHYAKSNEDLSDILGIDLRCYGYPMGDEI
ncbi:MAG: hypothetical protein SWO11_11000 [Thermodesulfobacteriota bacterium]|nr:hypothetical protein [Thermodesulfobacteriota bacterium]